MLRHGGFVASEELCQLLESSFSHFRRSVEVFAVVPDDEESVGAADQGFGEGGIPFVGLPEDRSFGERWIF